MAMKSLTLCSVLFSLALTLIAVGQNQPAQPSTAKKPVPEKSNRPGSPKPSPEKTAKPVPLLKPGDIVMIEILEPAAEAPNINSTYVIARDGTLNLPKLQAAVQVAGLTMEQLDRQLETAYRKEGVFNAPMFRSGVPKNCVCAHILTVRGEVKSGGREVPLRDGMRLYQAIMTAGGLTEFANAEKVKLIRGSNSTHYDLRKVLPDNSNNPVLKDGDAIYVPKK
jgi:protein involved in polysaccharide export with SLBB domain